MKGYNSLLTNCVLVEKESELYLFGEVVEDERFPAGNHILTSPVVSWNYNNMLCITTTGTIYKVEKLYSIEEYKEYVYEAYSDKSYCSYLLSCIGVL